jgi:hypothetical protein
MAAVAGIGLAAMFFSTSVVSSVAASPIPASVKVASIGAPATAARSADATYVWLSEFPISTPGETVPSASYNVDVEATTGAVAYFESRPYGSVYRWQLVFRTVSPSGIGPEELVGDPLPTGVTFPGGVTLFRVGDAGDFAIKVWAEEERSSMFTARQGGLWTPLTPVSKYGDPTVRAAQGQPVVTTVSGAWVGPDPVTVEVRYPTASGFEVGTSLIAETQGTKISAGFVDLGDPGDEFLVYQFFQPTDSSGVHTLTLRTWRLVAGNWVSQDVHLASSPRTILDSPTPNLMWVNGQLLATWTEFDGRTNTELRVIVTGNVATVVDPKEWPPGMTGYKYITARTGQRFAVSGFFPFEVYEQSTGEWKAVASYRLTSRCEREMIPIVGSPSEGPLLLVSLLCQGESRTKELVALNRDYTWTKIPFQREWNKLDVLPLVGGTAFATGWNQAGTYVGQWLKVQPLTTPTQPTAVQATWTGKAKSRRVAVSWGPPSQTGGGTLTYEARLCTATLCGNWKATSALRVTLASGSTAWKTVQVRALNDAGSGPAAAARIKTSG